MTAPDIRLDWETYIPEENDDQLLELLVFYGPPFPLRDQDGNEIVYPETSEASFPGSPCPSNVSVSSHTVPSLVSRDTGHGKVWPSHTGPTRAAGSLWQQGSRDGGTRAEEQIISVILQAHDAVPSGHIYQISPKQVVSTQGPERSRGAALACL